MRLKYISIVLLVSLLAVITSCKEDEYAIPVLPSGLHNDCIKHSLGPGVIGTNMVFAYAMALKPEEGKLISAQVEASIPGAEGTYLSNQSLYTDNSGNNKGITVGEPSVTSGKLTTVTFNVDTCAATLRYYYVIPEAARGQTVSFKFTAKATNGQTVSYDMGPYEVRRMDMKLDLVATDPTACFVSIADMTIMDAAAAAANPEKVDLVYLYRSITGITFNHALMSPVTDPMYLRDVTLPAGLTNKTKVFKTWNIQDQQLARLQYGVYVDDLDLEKMDFSGAPDYALNTRSESGLWVETSDGKYRAYIFINKTDNAGKKLTFSMKRLQMK